MSSQSAASQWKAISGWFSSIRSKRKEPEARDPAESSPPPSKRPRPEPRTTFANPRHVSDHVKNQARSSPIRARFQRGSRVTADRFHGIKPMKLIFDEPPPPGRSPVIPLGGAKAQENIPPAYMFTGKCAIHLDQQGFHFVSQCVEYIEKNGLDYKGLYRVEGSRVKISLFLEEYFSGACQNVDQSELKTVSSALKTYFRLLPEPLLPIRLHKALLTAANNSNKPEGAQQTALLIRTIPDDNGRMLALVIPHLVKVAGNSGKNEMTVSNLAVCWGPTLLRAEAETVTEIKTYNVVLELILEYWEQEFGE